MQQGEPDAGLFAAPSAVRVPATAPLPSSLIPLSSPVLVGRQAEMADLLELATHPPAVAVIEGEAGIGKSRLVAELRARCDALRRRTLIGRCGGMPSLLARNFIAGPCGKSY